MKKSKLYNFITKVGIFGALSSILYHIPRFSLPFFPAFLEIQFSNFPAILGGFVLGPIGAALIIIIRTLINMPFSKTVFVGEFADMIIGLLIVIPSSLVYNKYKTKKAGIISLILCSVTWVLGAIVANIYINIPLYAKIIPGGIESIVEMCSLAIKNINMDNFMKYYILYAVIPFNLLLSTIVNIVTFIIYTRVSSIFKRDFLNLKKKVLVISDSFKGTLTSSEVGNIICTELNNKKRYDAKYLPISDGGEGFLDSIKHVFKDAKEYKANTVNTLGNDTSARYLYSKKRKTLYIELAECVGICKINRSDRNVFKASTFGLGVVMKKAIELHKPKHVVLGIGGSASNDGGVGMLLALDVDFYDANGNKVLPTCNEQLKEIKTIDTNSFLNLIKGISFTTLSDVTNPLLGKKGATYVFSKQKGAIDEDYEVLEDNMRHYANIVSNHFNIDYSSSVSSGAAGGVGFAMRTFFNSKIESGIEVLLSEYHFEKEVKKYDIIITGEGCLDEQSLEGKVISGVLKYKPEVVHFVVGSSIMNDSSYTIHSVVPEVATKEESVNNPVECLKRLINKKY